MVESQMGSLRNIFFKKNASAPATIRPISAKASEKKISLLFSSSVLSTSTMLYKKMRLKKTQTIAILRTK
jgi:hypothetical protein